ncbi:DUF5642 family protein [Mycobacterium sp. 1423905.2]|uniref:DUF5642 family protein n=1 Tax=Mycobacterium sp. 1423905.2 TaxID=1856859 RepID=UPI0007FBE4F4|nr:DUF5642 family protein [Mycobacterium sp. 1423905.2]OBJ51933.1 hypothetical protein A9W95_21150 [Mycobacterium sp. 1423905.2]
MRPLWMALVALPVAACAHPSAPPAAAPHTSSPAAHGTAVNPANIKRVSRDLPPGYEVTRGIPSGLSPRAVWNLDADASVTGDKPAQCATLADPGGGRDQSAQGVSGSGAGGIVDAVVVALLSGRVALDHNAVAGCGQWTMSDRHTTANVSLIEAPHIDDADTVGMTAEVRTTVESGAQIDSRTVTFIAYLGGYYAFTTVTTDPGSMLPPLPPQFAADLLVKTVATLRS